jgi:hypothetical protein
MEEFIKNTMDPDSFVINDVIGDNSCLYRSLANYIYYAIPSMKIKQIKEFHKWGDVKDIDTVLKNFGYQSDEQEYLARLIQKKIVKYVQQHPDTVLCDEIGLSIRDYIPIVHEISYDEYVTAYSTFAGVSVEENLNSDNNDDTFTYDRWGSHLELLIISNVLKCPMIIFTSQKYNANRGKVETGVITSKTVNGTFISKPQKNVRLKVLQVIGGKYISKKLPVYLIWKKYKNHGHYMVCYPKQANQVDNYVKDIISLYTN